MDLRNIDNVAENCYNVLMAPIPRMPAVERMTLYRTARTLAQLTVRQLAEKANVSTATITKLEGSTSELKPATLQKIRDVLEDHGVEFIPHPKWDEWVQPKIEGQS